MGIFLHQFPTQEVQCQAQWFILYWQRKTLVVLKSFGGMKKYSLKSNTHQYTEYKVLACTKLLNYE